VREPIEGLKDSDYNLVCTKNLNQIIPSNGWEKKLA